ncbi:hypothetical protein FGRMN_11163 [Fusarium graminum]|nr:hypothetical protein FGRMN_11163 [Fusarium graminum]
MESFSDQEKRHLLAEIIKHSQINVHILEGLIKSHSTELNWMQVQLPNGRSMAQCLQAAHDMDILQRGTKRKAPNDEPGGQSGDGHQALDPQESYLVCCPPTAPRPFANTKDSPSIPLGHHPQLPQASELPPAPKKKKGRPAYAGREPSIEAWEVQYPHKDSA